MAHALSPATSKTSNEAVKDYVVDGPLPIKLPPHHRPAYQEATVQEDDQGKFICIPLINTDPYGFERKKRLATYKCKFCHSEKVSLGA